MAFCRNCGKEIEDSAKLCPNCGAMCDGSSSAGLSAGGVDYNELKFSANLVSADRHRKYVAILNIVCFVMIIIEAIISMVGDSAIISAEYGQAVGGSTKRGLMLMGIKLLKWRTPIIIMIITLIVSIIITKKGIKIFKCSDLKTINEKTTVGNLRKLNQFASMLSVLPILMFISSAYTLLSLVEENLFLYFREPELVSLMYGTTACSKPYIVVIFGVLGLSFFVCSQIVASRHNNIYRYFKSKLVSDAPDPLTDRKASKEERERNRKLIDAAEAVALGDEFTTVCKIYTDRFSAKSGEKSNEIKFNIKSEASCVKFSVVRWLWRGIPTVLAIVLAIVWISVAVTHSKVVVRPGSVGKIRLGDSFETVKDKLGKPGDGSSEFCYVYTDSDKIENFEDLMNAEIRQLCVYFVDGKVSEIRYDAGKTNNIFSEEAFVENSNISKRVTIKSYYNFEERVMINECITLYNDGSVRIYKKTN